MNPAGFSVLHLSDTHFGTERPAVVEAVVRLCEEQRPLLVVLSGDITQRARSRQFAAGAGFLARLAAPHKLALPGNHDIPLFNIAARMLHPYAGYRAAFGPELEPEVDLPALLAIGVNTTRPARHKDGEVSREQVARVAARLALARPSQLRLVVTHQPLHVITAADRKNRLHGAEAALAAWAAAGADLVLGGHIHLPYVRQIGGETGLPRALRVVQAGTAVSSRVRGDVPNSANVIRCEGDGNERCQVERWDFDAGAGRFACIETTGFDLDRRATQV